MKKLLAVLRLTRIEHSIMLVVAVLAAELLAGGLPSLGILLLSIITPIFVSMASFAVNDYYDIDVDRLNAKDRPLVNGSLKPREAVYVSAVCFAIGVGASALINAYALAIAAVFAALAFLYSYKLKEMFLLGNIYVALTMVIPFIFGDYVVSSALAVNVALICVMVFLSGLAREIHGTVRDYGGDVKARKARTLPRAIGIEGSSGAALVLYLAAIAVSAYLFLYIKPFRLNLAYGVIVLVSDLILLYVGIGYVAVAKRKFYEKTRNLSLFAMGIALIAIILSAIVYI